jgi:hypothetical protein
MGYTLFSVVVFGTGTGFSAAVGLIPIATVTAKAENPTTTTAAAALPNNSTRGRPRGSSLSSSYWPIRLNGDIALCNGSG